MKTIFEAERAGGDSIFNPITYEGDTPRKGDVIYLRLEKFKHSCLRFIVSEVTYSLMQSDLKLEDIKLMDSVNRPQMHTEILVELHPDDVDTLEMFRKYSN